MMVPTYCYTDAFGQTVERRFSAGRAPKSIRAHGRTYRRDLVAEHRGHVHVPDVWPVHSLALRVPDWQAPDVARRLAERGIPTDFRPDGRPVVTSDAHRAKLENFFHGDTNHAENG